MINSVFIKSIVYFSLLVLFSLSCFAQKNLKSKPVFFNFVSKCLFYPKGAINYSLYGRIFAKFEVDKKGHINNVQIIYPIINKEFEKKAGFENMIRTALTKILLLSLGYQGNYLLPIAFIYTNHGKISNVSRPNNILPSFIYVEDLISIA